MKKGIGVSKGYAIGTAFAIDIKKSICFKETAQDPAAETKRLEQAIEKSKEQLREIASTARKHVDAKNAEIIESHCNYLTDPSFTGEAFSKIKQISVSAEKAVSDVTQSLYDTFLSFDDDYTRERAEDIKDVGERILRNLSGGESGINFSSLPPNTILFAHDLKPSDTAQIDSQKVIAFVTETGGTTSHTAILAKALGIAAIVGCQGILSAVCSGDTVAVNGISGEVVIEPDAETIQKYRSLQSAFNRKRDSFLHSAQKGIHAKGGRKILVAANIGGLNDLKAALQSGADGVGLFRTEFLYMGRYSLPTEEEQFQVYKEAAELLKGKPLTIRTLDIGGDKSLPYLKMQSERNPFLGLRAIRLCLKNPDIFKTQLRAILRASVYGVIQMMFPMISSLNELQQAKKLLDDCKRELEQESVRYDFSIKVGMMIEIPSSALMAEEFAENVDFFSIGTNDLTQYTLAADRMNESVSDVYDPMHPAVLRLIKMSIEAAHKASIPCCMCGELAADEKAVALLLAYGLDEFSVSPGAVVETKNILLQSTNA